jgi:hypothetical protein
MSTVQNGAPLRFVQHRHDGKYNFTNDTPGSWMSVDLGAGRRLAPDHYCLRSDGTHSGSDYKPRRWRLEGSDDGGHWATLRTHDNDAALAQAPFSEAAWPVQAQEAVKGQGGGSGRPTSYRHFRILQTGANSSNSHHLMCAGIELYGTLEEEE